MKLCYITILENISIFGSLIALTIISIATEADFFWLSCMVFFPFTVISGISALLYRQCSKKEKKEIRPSLICIRAHPYAVFGGLTVINIFLALKMF